MKVLVNNKEVKTGATTLSQLIEELALPMQGIAVAVDNRICLLYTYPRPRDRSLSRMPSSA